MGSSIAVLVLLAGFGWLIVRPDIAQKRIPNRLTLAFFVACLVTGISFGAVGLADFATILGSAVLAGLAFLGLYFLARGGFGEADVKLSPGFGLLLGIYGFGAVISWILLTFVLAGGFAAFMLVTKKLDKKDEFAFAPFMFLGAVFIVLANLIYL